MLEIAQIGSPDRDTTDTIDRRTEPRYPTETEGEIEDLSSISPAHPAQLIDVSRSGMCLQTDFDLQRGVRVKVVFGDSMAFGEIRWCRKLDEHRFVAGVAVEHIVRRDLVSRIRSAADSDAPENESSPPDAA